MGNRRFLYNSVAREILCDKGTFHPFFLQLIYGGAYYGPGCVLDTGDTIDKDKQKFLMQLKC